MGKERTSGWSRKWSAFFALIIIVGGMTVSLGFAVRLRDALQRNADKRLITTSQALRTTVATQLSGYLDTVRSTAAGLSALPAPTKDTFTKITSAVAAQQLTAVNAISFLVPANPGQVDQVAATWRARGATGLKISPVKGAQQHLFTIFSRGLDANKAAPLGVDQVAAPAEVEVARVARTTGKVSISDAYILLADRNLPKAKQQLSFDVLAPIRTGRANTLIGYASLTIRGTEFLTANLSTTAGDLLDIDLLTRSAAGALTEVATVSAGRSQDVRRAENFEAGQRQWVLQTTAANTDLLPTAGRTDMAVLLAGSVLSVMFGTLMYLQMSATARADQEIELEVAERLAAAGLIAASAAQAPDADQPNADLPPENDPFSDETVPEQPATNTPDAEQAHAKQADTEQAGTEQAITAAGELVVVERIRSPSLSGVIPQGDVFVADLDQPPLEGSEDAGAIQAKAPALYIGTTSGEITLNTQTSLKPTNAEPTAAYPAGAKPPAKRARRNAATKPPAEGTEAKPRAARTRRPKEPAPAKPPLSKTSAADTTAESASAGPGPKITPSVSDSPPAKPSRVRR